MDALICSPTMCISPKNPVLFRSALPGSLILRKPRFPANSVRFHRVAAAARETAIDLSNPEWKLKFERDFEEKFNIPHITDAFPDAEAIPSTFCLKMRYVNSMIQWPNERFRSKLCIIIPFFLFSPVGLRRTLITKIEYSSRYFYSSLNEHNYDLGQH